jgi:diadenosine tetraphosphate (Ap4A) HIT family hydrolase
MCELCESINEKNRLICETEYSFCVICKWPLKSGHILVLPKKCVSQKGISLLNSTELNDLMSLIQRMENTLNLIYTEDVITFKNSNSHSTQLHLHYHLLPSKGALRDLFSNFENIPNRELISEEKELEMRDLICDNLVN